MSFNTLIWVGGGLLTGRYIGDGRDTSGPTGCRVRSSYPCYFVKVHNRVPTGWVSLFTSHYEVDKLI